MSPKDLDEHIKAKAGYVLDAFDEGIFLFDPHGFLQKKKSELFAELKKRGVKRTKLGWEWPIKASEVTEM